MSLTPIFQPANHQSPAPRPRNYRGERDRAPIAVAESAFALLATGSAPLTLDCRPYAGLPDRDVPLLELRQMLLARSCPRATRDAVWAELVRCSRTYGGSWTVGCVGMALPALVRMESRIAVAYDGDRADLQAEILSGFLAGLASIDLDKPSVINRLRWHAYRAGHAAVRDQLNAAFPVASGFESSPPPASAGHPDFVLARAVTEQALSQLEADVIGSTRLEEVSLREWAADHQLGYAAARQLRSRAERRLLAWLTQSDTAPGSATSTRRVNRTARTGVQKFPGRASHLPAESGLDHCPTTLHPHAHTASPEDTEESRCA